MPVITPLPPGTADLTATAITFLVVRYDRSASGNARFAALPNVQCLSYRNSEEGTPPSAQFRYLLDSTDPNTQYPYLYEHLWPRGARSPWKVENDDEILVYGYDSDNNRRLVFDGFATTPRVDQGDGLTATFSAVNVGVRLWDKPIQGSLWRDSTDPQAGAVVSTDIPGVFNPVIKGETTPNRTPDGYDVNEGAANAYPVFMDPGVVSPKPGSTPGTPDVPYPALWTLGQMVRYLCQKMNPDETWVKNPVAPWGLTIDDYLMAVTPAQPGGYMDLTDPSTYTTAPIVIRSFNPSGQTLVPALLEQLGYYGFHLCLNTREDLDGAPINEMVIYRVDGRDGVAPVELFFPQQGASLADRVADFRAISLSRDQHDSANEFESETALNEYEVSVCLAAGFAIAAGDNAPGNLQRYNLSSGTGGPLKDYRYFVFDEAGLGHWDGTTFKTGTPTSLDAVLGGPAEGEGPANYVTRLRPGRMELASKDDKNQHFKADLSISYDYAGPQPGLWDGSGTWRSLGTSGWRLDKDSLSVWLTCDNPEKWQLPKAPNSIAPGDVVKVVTSLSGPTTRNPPFSLRLTTVIHGDQGIDAVAQKRDASPMRFAVRRLIDSRDHWKLQTRTAHSLYNNGSADEKLRDDTEKAKAQAESLRLTHEFPVVSGPVVVPWVSYAVGIGDLVSRINGRNIDLSSNAGGAGGESPHYPAVVAVSYTCTNPQTTTLHLSDEMTEPEKATHGYARMARR